MKFHRSLSAVWLALLVVTLSSCDKVTALVDKAKALVGGEEPAAEEPPEPAIRPMPKDWLPPGVTREGAGKQTGGGAPKEPATQ